MGVKSPGESPCTKTMKGVSLTFFLWKTTFRSCAASYFYSNFIELDSLAGVEVLEMDGGWIGLKKLYYW